MILAATNLAKPDYFVLIGYFVLMLGIGAYFYRFMKGMKDYFSGGNNIPWWLSGVSFYMSSFSVFAFVYYSALAYKYGWVAVTLFWVTIPATIVGVLFFASRWRRARIDSPVEYLETRYGIGVRQLFAWQGIPVRIIDDAFKLVAIGTFISVGLGLPLGQSMFWSGVIMLAYTFMGGLWAVAVTDFIQFVVMAAAIVVLLPLSLAKVGGVGGFVSGSPEGFFKLIQQEQFSWIYVGSHIILFTLAYSSINWSLIQRYYCVPKEKDARKVGWLVVVLNIITPPLMFIPAMAARQFLPDIEAKGVYPELCVALLPAGMLGLVIAAMFSATMSMLSSDYNVCASVLTNDVYRRLFNPGARQKTLVFVGRLMTLVIGVVALGLAFTFSRGSGEEMFRNMVKLFSIATAPVAIPMLLGLLSKRMTNAGALAGFLCGVSVGLLLFFLGPEEGKLLGQTWKLENLLLLGTAGTTALVMVVVSFALPAGHDQRRRAEDFLHRLTVPIGELPGDVVPGTGKAGVSPFRVVGISIVFIGVMMLAVAPWVRETLALAMDLAIGAGLAVIGLIMAVRSRPSEAPPEPPETVPPGATGFEVVVDEDRQERSEEDSR
ncbi:MAG: hypothetical protein JXQ73_06380 [Phycisphaerae bacterium]|nr:hypothetical protein [Phycisphaerae bacterium]